ncbi:hypothetical protein BDD12DRAFT_874572 [Trichophaea hybrida]|nr:hypothetical protein BDD12DRAFT_874572 [Trichophaea hybrida]
MSRNSRREASSTDRHSAGPSYSRDNSRDEPYRERSRSPRRFGRGGSYRERNNHNRYGESERRRGRDSVDSEDPSPRRKGPTQDPADEPERKRKILEKESTPSQLTAATSAPKCFRICGIPSDWSEDDLQGALQDNVDTSLRDQHPYQLSLYPACCGPTKTALLNLEKCTDYFYCLDLFEAKYERIPKTAHRTEAHLVIDCHFHDLTPLNTPDDEIIADVVAVTGLAGHAFGSWRSRETHLMWLKDFLPKDIKKLRIMTYGYNSSLVGGTKSARRMSDYRSNFIQQLENARSFAENRPIVFLGHSLGGILILQTLVELNRSPHHKHILDSIQGIFFFGTPHEGLRTNELENLVDNAIDGQDSKRNLLMQLKEGSEFLENQKHDLSYIWEGFKGKIISFFETVKTKTVKKIESKNFARDGDEAMMVTYFSAQLFLPCEHRLPVQKDHTNMVKFPSSVDTTYQAVVHYMEKCVGA